MIEHLRPHVAKWWLPDAVIVLEELPHTATGKILKGELRRRFWDCLNPETGNPAQGGAI